MTENFQITRESGGIIVLSLVGDFTNETTPQYQKMCNEIIARQKVKAIILDFEKVLAIDTSAFACMINFIKEHTGQDARMALIHIHQRHRDLLEILKLKHKILYYETKEQALRALSMMGKENVKGEK